MNKPIKINSLKGILLSQASGKPVFRVYDAVNKRMFTDYDILHQDLEITIDDNDAFLYQTKNGDSYIDYSPETLGVGTND